MTVRHYLLRSLLHYRFAYLGVLAGAVLGATVLLGALFAGDSIERSLHRIAVARIGRATHALTAGDRFFREALAEDFAAEAKVRAAPVLLARGTTAKSGAGSANHVQLVGVTPAFWQFAPQPAAVDFSTGKSAVAINDTLARRLQLAVGDTLIVRLQKPGILAGNAPVAGAESSLQSLRCTVVAIVGDEKFGRFNLDATQVPAPSVFLPIALLQEALERPARANLLLIDAGAAAPDLRESLGRSVQLADYGLAFKWLERAATFELSSDRIFIDPELADAVIRALPTAQPVVSYLVNELRAGERTTPYSMATATTPAAAPFLPADLGPREIVLNDWLAGDLQTRAGDEVRLTFYQTGPTGALAEQTANFRVRSIVPLQDLAADPAWMPEFPGITDTKNQSDWNPGLPLKLDRIREKDEKYWDDHRGAPKAFLSLAGGQEIWSTRWGNTTALRFAEPRDQEATLTRALLAALRPESNQLTLQHLRANAQGAAKSSVDFGGLFLGMSFFLILAALGLVAMLFQLCLLQRNREGALLAAVGLPPRKVLRWHLTEGAVLLLLACAAGLPLATIYTRGILGFLETIWAGQGAGPTFAFAAKPASIGIGVIAFVVCSLFGIWLTIRRQARRALSVRLAAQVEDVVPPAKIRRSSRIIAVVAGVVAVAAVGSSRFGLPAQVAFYLAGFALLAAGISLCRLWLARESHGVTRLDASTLGGLNLKSRRARNLTVVGLIATAVFMVLSVASFRKHVGADWVQPTSGTGGFAFLVETTAVQNVARDTQARGFEIFARHAAELSEIVPLRAGAGDNSNCFNLNTTSQPKLLAVDAAKLASRGAFRPKIDSGWNALRTQAADGAIPALVDATTLQWALKRKVGDVLAYADENGRAFSVRIAGTLPDSIFQGYVVVDEALFLQKFPSHAGYSLFLIDAKNPADLTALRTKLETALVDAGGRVEITRDVLAAFHEIENTYIAIFNVLGSLGVVLGSLGLAIVVARNLRERRGEFAVMTAIGIPREVLARMVFSEFSRLIAWGLGIGVLASLVAILPNLTALPPTLTLAVVVTLLLGITLLNLFSSWVVFRWSLRDLHSGIVQGAA